MSTSSKSDSKLAAIIQSRYTTLSGEQQQIFDEVADFKQMYRSYMTQSESYPWDYQLVDPLIFPLIRAHLARLNPQDAKIILESRTGNDNDARRTNQQIINWELEEIMLTQVFYRMMFSGFIAGKGYIKSGWHYEQAVSVKDGKRTVQVKQIENRADLKSVRFTDLFIPNRNIPELASQPYLVEQISMRFGEMWDMNEEEDYWKPDLLKEIKEKKLFDNKVEYGVDMPTVDDDTDEELAWRNQYVKLLCMHTLDGDVLYTMQSGMEKILNKKQGNEYYHNHYPYIEFAPFPEDDEFFSMGIVQPVADLQIATSSVLNQLLTNARKQANPMWIKGQEAAQTPDWMFVNRPDGVISVVGSIDQVREIPVKDTSAPLITLRSELNASFEKGSSMSSFYTSGTGSSPQINKTATGAKIIDQNLDINLQLLIALFGAQVLKTVGEHFLELNAQYITEEQTFRITGKEGKSEFITTKPDEVSANFDVRVSPERILKQSPALRQASLLNLFSTLSQAKKEGAPINLTPVVEAVIDAFPETENIDNIMIDPEQKANEVIHAVERGVEPPKPSFEDNHKAMIGIIQRYMIDAPELSDEQLQGLTEYLADLKTWIQAKNPQLLTPPAPAPNPSAMPPQMPPDMGGGEPPLLPASEQGLMQSLSQTGMPQNPGAELPIPLTQDQLGMPGGMV